VTANGPGPDPVPCLWAAADDASVGGLLLSGTVAALLPRRAPGGPGLPFCADATGEIVSHRHGQRLRLPQGTADVAVPRHNGDIDPAYRLARQVFPRS
jgi:hypothetical protein